MLLFSACQTSPSQQINHENQVLDSLGKWTALSDLPYPAVEQMGAFKIGSKGYMVGGWDGTKAINQTLVFDPVTNHWDSLTSLPSNGLYQTTTIVCMGKAYLICGSNNQGLYGNQVWEFQPQKNKWVPKKAFPGIPRYAAAGFCSNNSIYFGTGIGTNGQKPILLNDWWVYHPEKDSWQQLKNIPHPGLAAAAALNINEQGYLGIGSELDQPAVWMAYDDHGDHWITKSPFPGKIGKYHTALVIQKKGYVQVGNSNQCWEYDPANDHWQPLKSAPFSKSAAAAFSIGYKGYLFGGTSNGQLQKDVWEFSVE